jgi:hypothetical protein
MGVSLKKKCLHDNIFNVYETSTETDLRNSPILNVPHHPPLSTHKDALIDNYRSTPRHPLLKHPPILNVSRYPPPTRHVILH